MPEIKITEDGVVTVSALTCDRCGDTIYSTSRYHLNRCVCGKFFIDGGFDYVRSNAAPEMVFDLKVQLYEGTITEWAWPEHAGTILGPFQKRIGWIMVAFAKERIKS